MNSISNPPKPIFSFSLVRFSFFCLWRLSGKEREMNKGINKNNKLKGENMENNADNQERNRKTKIDYENFLSMLYRPLLAFSFLCTMFYDKIDEMWAYDSISKENYDDLISIYTLFDFLAQKLFTFRRACGLNYKTDEKYSLIDDKDCFF